MTDPIEWINDYIGLPYRVGGRDRSGVDCYGLVRLVLNEQAGATLPEMPVSADLSAPRQARALTEGAAQLISEGHARRVYTLENLAVIILRRGLLADHCGLYWEGYVLHAHRQFTTTVLERVETFERFSSSVEVYQWQP